MRHVKEGQRIAISVMCTNLHIAADDLLTEDVITHQEFKGLCAFANDRLCDCNKNIVRTTNLMKLPEGEKLSFPSITPDPNNPEHYMTFTQLKAALSFSNPDQLLKDGTNEGCRKCRYIFTSEADKEHHIRQVHSGVRVREEDGSTSQAKKSKSDIKCTV